MNSSNDCQLQTPQDIKSYLHHSLANIPDFKDCALLDYPASYNIGDHLIWLGSLFYITQVRQARIKYVCTIGDGFSESELSTRLKDEPIFFNGGGNFGDLWPGFQNFRKKIINHYHNRPIVVLPQTLYFSSDQVLEESAKIFNRHPNLTLFMRDDRSLEIAKQAFFKCKVYKAPDIAFQMVGLPDTNFNITRSGRILYVCRKDRESNYDFKPKNLKISNLDVDDWVSFRWLKKLPKDWVYVPGLVRLVREGWQRGLKTPKEWLSRQAWQRLHPYASVFDKVHHHHLHRISWGQMHSGIYQLQAYDLIITNRLHVHILCLILNIPHILLPGSYYKIRAFHQAWTSSIPFCRFVENVEQIPDAIEDLKKCYLN